MVFRLSRFFIYNLHLKTRQHLFQAMSGVRLLRLMNCGRFFCHTGSSKRFRVLGIETSCDDTGVAVVDSDRTVLGESKYSQGHVHALHGGIIPPLAKELHQDNIRKAVNEAIEKSKLSIKDLDGIAVTVKPGMPMSLHVGIDYAKDLCTLYSKPLIPIHHMEAHAFTVRLLEDVEFPFLVLLTSGGHCILALVESVTKFTVLCGLSDNAPGVILDKLARRLNLRTIEDFASISGGVAIEAAAKKGNPDGVSLPFNARTPRGKNFHFSGFQNAVEQYVEAEEKRLKIVANQALPNVYDVCATLQFLIFKYICERLEIGIRYLDLKNMINKEKRTLVVSGGVASNETYRRMLKELCSYYHYDLVAPPKDLCTDNGVMIAWNAIERLRVNVPVVSPDKLHLVQPIARCDMGKNISSDVAAHAWKGSYFKFKEKKNKEEKERLSTESLTEPKSEVNLLS